MSDIFTKLEEIGCPLVGAPLDPSIYDGELPFLAIMHGTGIPTEEELITISELILHLARVCGAPASKSQYREAPTVTVRKVDVEWEFIQPSREMHIHWKRVQNLHQLFKEL